ncbi:elongation factor P 5-aminopentanone reductase [Liquorilactobacillus sicerae]|uniref:elongation factor P 5-aminopentanone reductase n=1 Tax=Liquorilactobacillus sicerae TaxID=1416943 RepID=UPI0024802E23
MKWALIIGASGDIGTQIAEELAADGWSLYLHYFKSSERAHQLQKKLTMKFARQDFLLVQADLTTDQAVDELSQQLFSLDALIFAQGTTNYGLFQKLPAREMAKMVQMQLLSPLHLIQVTADKLAINHFGRIIFIGSIYGGVGSAMEVGYSTVKGALSAFANAYSKEVASLGVTVNVIAPGAVATRMNNMFSPTVRQAVAAEIPAGHFASSQEIAYWVKVILATEADYLTGQTIYVTGGWLK